MRTICLAACAAALAAPSLQAAPLPSAHALENARIIVAPGRIVDRGTVVIRDGVIVAAGADIASPDDARVHDLDGKTIYPGLIDAYSEAAWPEMDDDATPQGVHPNPYVRPERRMADHGYDTGRFSRLRAAGFTHAVVSPEPGILRGTSALFALGEGGAAANLVVPDVAQNATFRSGSFGEGYPTSLMGAEALFRQAVLDARWYEAAQAAYREQPAQKRPAWSPALASLGRAVSGDMPLAVRADDALESLRWATLADELELTSMMMIGHGHEYERLERIAAIGQALVLPMSLPSAPEVGDEDDGTVSTADLRHFDRAPDNLRHLLEAGVTVALTTYELSDPKKLHEHLATAIERGLSADDALAALTTTPADLLGIADRVGTVERGKAANLVIVDGDLFVKSPKIAAVWVDGTRYEIKVTEAPSVDPSGTWSVTIDAGPGGTMAVTVTLTGSADAMEGTIGTPAGQLPFQSVVVSGDTVELELDGTPLGMPGTISFSMKVDGDSAKGSGQAPPGPFTLRATRTSKPDSPEVDR